MSAGGHRAVGGRQARLHRAARGCACGLHARDPRSGEAGHDADTVFRYVVESALAITGKDPGGVLTREDADAVRRLFREMHQYFQADMSSHTSVARYTPWGQAAERPGPRLLDEHFEIGDGKGTLLQFDYEHPPRPPKPNRLWHLGKVVFNKTYWHTVPKGRV